MSVHLLVCLHIPKTGGLSLRRSVLQPAFGDRLLLDYDDAPLSHEMAERNAWAQAYEPPQELLSSYDCVHGHFLATKYVSKRTSCQFSAWFRDPVERVLSRFFYSKRNGGGIVTPEMTLWEFCAIKRFHNVYAKYLWGFDIGRFDFVGITEDYTNSIEAFRRHFGIPGGTEMTIENANPNKATVEPYGVDRSLRDFIRRTNRDDVDIYEEARSINLRLQRQYL